MSFLKSKCFKNDLSLEYGRRLLSCSSINLYPFKGRFPDPLYKTKSARQANRPFYKQDEFYKEVILAQKKRNPWEYPLQPHDRASWKHRKWKDVHNHKWVSTLPDGYSDSKLSIHYQKERKNLANADNTAEQLTMLLDGYKGTKFVIPEFDQYFPQTNMSYFYQHLTYTKYIHGLPYSIQYGNVDENKFENFKKFVEQLLFFEHQHNLSYEKIENPFKRKQKLNNQVMKAIANYLSFDGDLNHLSYDNEVSMFWLRGRGFWKKGMPDDICRVYQTHINPILQVTSTKPLPYFSSISSSFSLTGAIPLCTFSPYLFRHKETSYRNSVSTGERLAIGDLDVNYQEAFEEDKLSELPPPRYNQKYFGHTQICLTPENYSREWYEENMEHGDITNEIDEHLKAQGIMSGWAWTGSQAHYAGHYIDNDVTSPWCSQTIVFDGKFLSFFGYQLNTLAISENVITDHMKKNLCFGKPSVPLYDEVTDSGVKGLNEEALRIMFKMLSNDVNRIKHSDEDISSYNNSLQSQEVDPEKSSLEEQTPLHVVQKELMLIEEAEKLEEERLKTGSLKDKLKYQYRSFNKSS